LPWPTREATFVAGPAASSLSRYSAKLLQLHSTSGLPLSPARSLRQSSTTSSLSGASPSPSWPTISVVTPCITFSRASGSTISIRSEWLWTSMNPGATTRPPASITRSASEPNRPMAAILPRLTATSARCQGLPAPSTILPPFMTRLNIPIRQVPGCVKPFRWSSGPQQPLLTRKGDQVRCLPASSHVQRSQ